MISYTDELYHHGIKGQKWGVRRYRNEDGTLTAAGRQRYGSDNLSSKNRAKKIAAAAGAATLAVAAAYVASNSNARAAVANAVTKLGSVSSAKATSMARKGKNYAKKAAKQAKEGIKEGIKEGTKEAPKKLVKTVMIGGTMYAGKKILDKAVGPDDAGRIMKANDKKKIGSFWAYIEPDKPSKQDEDDD